MTKIGKNIRKIRTVYQLTQTSFGDLFGITRASIGAYEEGRSEPKIELLNTMAKYFGIPLEQFIDKTLSVNDILHFKNEVSTTPSIYNKTNTAKLIKSVPYISKQHIDEFVQKYDNEDYIKNLPMLTVPISGNYSFLAIDVYGAEMAHHALGFDNGDIVFCIANQATNILKHNAIYILITDNELMIRQFKQKNGKQFWAYNTNIQAYESLNGTKILAAYQIRAKYISNLKNHLNINAKIPIVQQTASIEEKKQ